MLRKSENAKFMNGLDEVARNAVRAGVIKHFEFTYGLCWKFIKRWLESNVGPGEAEGLARRELYRRAAENLLIADVEQWMRYHDARNRTSHVYQPRIAEAVYRVAGEFGAEAMKLLEALEARND